MKVSSFKVIILFLALTVLGFFVIPKLAVKLNPSQGLSSISIRYSWSNAFPKTVEQDITSVLESGFSTVRGIESIRSISSKGSGRIHIDFNKKTDINQARFEIATIIRQLYRKLPRQVSYPIISVNKPDDDDEQAFLGYSINAPFSAFEIQEFVKNKVEPVISSIEGIDKVTVYGANPKEYILQYDNNQLRSLKLKKEELITALNNYFADESLGNITHENSLITLSIKSKEFNDNWHLPIKEVEGKLLYLDNLVSIREQEQETQNYYRIDGKNSITLSVFASKNANNITLVKKVTTELDRLSKNLPVGYQISNTYDTTQYLKTEIDKIYKRSFYTVIVLLIFILVISRSFRYLLITTTSIIANIVIAFLLYYIFNVEIQLYSLAGITISLGLIIDNCIVVIDHIRHQKNKHVFLPILASTLTTIGALGIIHFLDETYRVNLIDFALVIIINLTVSITIAFLLVPALLEKIPIPIAKENQQQIAIKEKGYALYHNLLLFLISKKRIAIVVLIVVFGLPIFLLPNQIENKEKWYGKLYNSTIGNEWFSDTVRPSLEKYAGGTFRLFSIFVFEKSQYNRNEETKLYVNASMEKGATVHQMNEVFLELENYLSQFDEINQFVTNITSGDYGRMEITFQDKSSLPNFPFLLKSRITRKAIDFGGIEWNIYGVGKGYSNSNFSNEQLNYSVQAKGYNYDQLNDWADTLKIALEEHPRVHNVIVRENSFDRIKPSYQYTFSLEKEKLALAGVSPDRLIEELQDLTLSKYQETSLKIDGKQTSIRFQSKASEEYDVWNVQNAPLDSLEAPFILKEVATVEKQLEEENIHKENQEYIRRVDFQYTGSGKAGSKYLNDTLEELALKLPLGYQFKRQRGWKSFGLGEAKNYSYLLFLVLSIIYFVCAVLFENFRQPFIIISVIPISFIGVFLTFYLFDFNFDQGGLSSFVLLSGITVNASIFIIDQFNKLKKEYPKRDKMTIYLEAFKQKIFPILLTVLSTVLGFIPFVKDGQNEVFWFALGVGTIGGLIFSLIGILFYLPLFTIQRKSLLC